jgi:triosephosphate isomerase
MGIASRKLIVGNWKMHGILASLAELDVIAAAAHVHPDVDVAVCLPFTLIAAAAARNAGLDIGAQDCHVAAEGAYTGCVSVPMIADAGGRLVIVGHSERRAGHCESNALVQAKAAAVMAAQLTAIVCVGETEVEREAGRATELVTAQVQGSIPRHAAADRLVVAYEPVWAIGTGRTPSIADIAEMHSAIRAQLAIQLGEEGGRVRILYGGSVKPSNAADVMKAAHVDGALIGGASLVAAQFEPIITTAAN